MSAGPLVSLPQRRRHLAALRPGDTARVADIDAPKAERLRLLELGFVPGTVVRLVRTAPLGDPMEVELRGFRLSLRRHEAQAIATGHAPTPPPASPYRLEPRAALAPALPDRVMVLGNPNCGKSTLFAALSGQYVRTANHPGVTVSAQHASVELEGEQSDFCDLPGCYSLTEQAVHSPEEALATRLVRDSENAALLVVVDATALERSLYLALEAVELGRPMVCAVNMLDEAEHMGLRIDLGALSAWLGVPCIGTVATKRRGIAQLKQALAKVHPPARVATGLGDAGEEAACIARYGFIDAHIAGIANRPATQHLRTTDKVDAVLTHPLGGALAFVATLALMFSALFTLSQPLMDGITHAFNLLGDELTRVLPKGALTDLLAHGLLGGVGTTLAFLPQIVLLLAFISTLEAVGYLSRAAFLIDRLMRFFGMSGKAFVPMLSGYACAVPAILALRTLERKRDRLLTMLVLPLMSCSARLPVYTLILAILFPANRHWLLLPVSAWLLLAIYAASTFFAFLALAVLSRTVAPPGPARLVLELPPYRMPDWRLLARTVAQRSADFLQTAGTIIVILSAILWATLHFPNPPPADASPAVRTAALERSYAAMAGHAVLPFFAPLGFDWKIDVGLIGSFAAREVFVATLGVIHGQSGDDKASLAEALRGDVRPSGEKLYTPRTALSLLLFFMLACQCTSTLAVMRRETGSWKWPAFAFVYMTALAYIVSFLAYQATPFLD